MHQRKTLGVNAVRRLIWLLLNAVSGRSGTPAPPPAPEPANPGVELTTPPPEPATTAHRRDHKPGFELDCGAPASVAHVGIVFVHGIGSQEAGSTLLDWSSKIIALLLDARSSQEAKGDPVI